MLNWNDRSVKPVKVQSKIKLQFHYGSVKSWSKTNIKDITNNVTILKRLNSTEGQYYQTAKFPFLLTRCSFTPLIRLAPTCKWTPSMVTATFASSLTSTTRMINWIHGYSSNHRSSAQPTALTSLPKHLSFMAGVRHCINGGLTSSVNQFLISRN